VAHPAVAAVGAQSVPTVQQILAVQAGPVALQQSLAQRRVAHTLPELLLQAAVGAVLVQQPQEQQVPAVAALGKLLQKVITVPLTRAAAAAAASKWALLKDL
jgi:ethanolamine transporter EutH